MADMVDERLFADLAEKEIDQVTIPGFCEFDEQRRCYKVTAWGESYEVFPWEKRINAELGSIEPHDYFYVFLINYLLSEKKADSTGEWISEKDLVGGVTFFRGPHEIPTHLISGVYGNETDLIKQRCAELGGNPLDLADISFGFDVIGSIQIALLYWCGDEDFPAEAKLLLDSSVAATLKLDVIYALLCDTCKRIGGEKALM